MMNQAFRWATEHSVQEPPSEYYCPTRDIADGRLPKLYQAAISGGLNEKKSSVLTAIVAELAANCFDHNLGSWKDVSGCWFSLHMQDNLLQITIADRGQGILQSLRHADTSLASHSDALLVALTKQISGRQPERRGRGLKYIMKSLNEEFSEAHFLIQTGNAQFETIFPLMGEIIVTDMENRAPFVYGTYAKLEIAMNVK
jgi:anti-sigma regulatory factor (Ser/Thr protein kinase)